MDNMTIVFIAIAMAAIAGIIIVLIKLVSSLTDQQVIVKSHKKTKDGDNVDELIDKFMTDLDNKIKNTEKKKKPTDSS